MLLKIHPEDTSTKKIVKVVEVLQRGGVIIYPTDTVYGFGCDIMNHKAIERIARLKKINIAKKNLSFVCYDLSQLSDFTRQIDNPIFKLMKKNLPGPFTFILAANGNVPRLLKSKKKTVGIRIPDHSVTREIVRVLGNPIITTSLHSEDEILEYPTDPELIWEMYKDKVDLVIDSGYGGNKPSTIVDCSKGDVEITRQSIGELIDY